MKDVSNNIYQSIWAGSDIMFRSNTTSEPHSFYSCSLNRRSPKNTWTAEDPGRSRCGQVEPKPNQVGLFVIDMSVCVLPNCASAFL